MTSVTTNGTNTATVQGGGPPDTNQTAKRTGGFTQGIVIDSTSGITLPPTTDFVTARACYRVMAPAYSGTYPVTFRFTHDVGDPRVRSVVTQQGHSNVPCARNFTLNIQVGGCYPQYPTCSLSGSSLAASAGEKAETVIEGEIVEVKEEEAPQPQVSVVAGLGPPGGRIDFTRRIPPDRDLPFNPLYTLECKSIRATPDGRFFVFTSQNDLGFGQSPNAMQVYRASVNDRNVSTIDLVSLDTSGQRATVTCGSPSISDDGQVVVFDTSARLDPNHDANTNTDVYLRDFRTSLACTHPPCTRLVSAAPSGQAGNNQSWFPYVSGNGNVVVFSSTATDLVTSPIALGDTDNVYRVSSGGSSPSLQMEMVSVDDTGPPTPCTGGDPNHCRTFELDAYGIGKVMNVDGNLIVFQGAPQSGAFQLLQLTNCSNAPFQNTQIFLRDLRNPANKRTYVVSAVKVGASVFCATTLRTMLWNAVRPSISDDGSRVVFQAEANNLIGNDLNPDFDIYMVDVSQITSNTMVPVLISVNSQGVQPTAGESNQPILTSDGTHVVFVSHATTLADQPPDTNNSPDVFVRHLDAGKTLRMNLDAADQEANSGSHPVNPDVFLGGRAVVYESIANNLLNPDQDDPFFRPIPDTNGYRDVFESRLKPEFSRGDADSSGVIDITDPIVVLNALFLSGPGPECLDSADANDDGFVDISDVVTILYFMFLGGTISPPSYPNCGFDPTDDLLSCRRRGILCPANPISLGLHSHE